MESKAERLSKNPTNLKLMWDKAKKMYTELKVTGLSDMAIAGILGNMAQESSFIAGLKGGSHVGYVLNEPRIINWVVENFGGYDHRNLVDYLVAGLTNKLPNTSQGVGSMLYERFNNFLTGILNIKTTADAVALWESAYEKSNGQELKARINYGNYFYNKILEEWEELQPKQYGPLYSENGDLSIYLTIDPPESLSNGYTQLMLDEIHRQLLNRQKNLPKIPFNQNYKNGGRLIKKGQFGTPIYHKDLYLLKDGDEQTSPHSELKSWIPDIRPEERMDLTTLLLNERLSTYKPTKELQMASLGIAHPFHWYDYLAAAPIALPVVGAAVATAPEWGPPALAAVSSPAFWGELIKDTGTYIAADVASQGLTGKGIGAHVNNALGLEEEHPVGELTGFGGTGMLRKAVSNLILKLFEKKYFGNILDYIAKEVSNSLKPITEDVGGQSVKTWYGTKFYLNNGKIRLRLPEHTQANPQEIVLEPYGKDKLGVNLWRLHIRIPNAGRMSDAERNNLLQILYEEFPKYSVIVPPESSIEEPVKRGAVAAYRWISRDPKFVVGKTNPKPVIYPGRNKYREATIFHPVAKRILNFDEANEVFLNALKQGKETVENYIGSEAQVLQLINAGATEETAKAVALEMRNNMKLVTNFSSNPKIKPGEGVYAPEPDVANNTMSPYIEIGEPKSVLDLLPTIEAIIHEYGGHAPTLAATRVEFSPDELLFIKKLFPHFSEVKAHNLALKPERISLLKDEAKLPTKVANQVKYLEDIEEYAGRTRAERMGSTTDMLGYDIGFTEESVERLRKLIWGLSPFGLSSTLFNSNLRQ